MGYQTNYTLEHDVTEDALEDVRDRFGELQLGFVFDNGGCNEISWYEHEEHLGHIAAMFPEFTFTLTGVGEHEGDMWKKRFRGDMVEEVRAEIVWPEFEELTDEVEGTPE